MAKVFCGVSAVVVKAERVLRRLPRPRRPLNTSRFSMLSAALLPCFLSVCHASEMGEQSCVAYTTCSMHALCHICCHTLWRCLCGACTCVDWVPWRCLRRCLS